MNRAAPSPRALAEAAQRRASDPAASAFVAASAGSGKTKLLTDRVLRLLLAGAAPERILCLTFTKAAAAEMALRLQRRLADWVVASDADLDAALRALDTPPGAAARFRARALFARVLDQPGGMRIGTIHAFCQSLLRRFPLEAEISPHFSAMEASDAAELLAEAREAGLARTADPAAVAELAGLCSLADFAGHLATLRGAQARLGTRTAAEIAAAQRRVLGVTAASEDEIMAAAVPSPNDAALRRAARVVAEHGAPTAAARALFILDMLSRDRPARLAAWDDWADELLNSDGGPYKPTTYVNKKLLDKQPDLVLPFLAEVDHILTTRDRVAALGVARRSAALVSLALPMLADYDARKLGGGRLDFDDLIARAGRLLHDPGAAWVLYKLDGGLDHLLLDEVQDTAPAQWAIAHALSAEFFAGAGAREDLPPGGRTVFAVGDRKQSIYSFQGADAAAFDAEAARLAGRVRDAGADWRHVPLDVSFRSTEPVLALVDAVFADSERAEGVVPPGETLRHLADRAGHAGRIDLWPIAPRPDGADEDAPWTVAADNETTLSAPERVARELARWIAAQTAGDVMLESRGRPLHPGDVMVLLRSRGRGGFAASLVRALKKQGVPVAGLDRMALAEQPAVADLLALCDTLLLPEDDLTLAGVLRSPLGGMSEDSLAALAIGRQERLWPALVARAAERPDWTAAHGFIARLLGRVDYATPHALLTEALGEGGGRARLLRRFGPEAGEPVDELLAAALRHAAQGAPSLQGFVHWLRGAGIEAKREAEASAAGAGGDAADSPGMVRIMTIHGAKGLQAPLVILPDTTLPPPDRGGIFWTPDPSGATTPAGDPAEVPLFTPVRDLGCGAVERLRMGRRAAQAAEENRLLYVALTRAEDRLLICGWQPGRRTDTYWHGAIEAALATLPGVERTPFDAWSGTALMLRVPQTRPLTARPPRPDPDADADAQPETQSDTHAGAAPLPAWAGAAPDWRPVAPAADPPGPVRLAPSRPEDAALGPVPAAASPLDDTAPGARFRRGQIIHALLQLLPDLPPADRPDAARAWLARHGLTDALDEVLGVLGHPDLAPLFGPAGRSEVPLTGVVGGQVIGGLVDRLAVLADRVLIADYKTNRTPPVHMEATPVLYLRQMAAYRALLRAIHPGRRVTCALVWTRATRVDVLPPALLDAHAPPP